MAGSYPSWSSTATPQESQQLTEIMTCTSLPANSDESDDEDHGLDKEALIELVRAYPCIWDIRSHMYKDQQKKKLAWQDIYTKMDQKHEGEKKE